MQIIVKAGITSLGDIPENTECAKALIEFLKSEDAINELVVNTTVVDSDQSAPPMTNITFAMRKSCFNTRLSGNILMAIANFGKNETFNVSIDVSMFVDETLANILKPN